MHLFIAYHARFGVTEAKVDNIIEFLNRRYLGLGRKSQLDNGYNFLKKYVIASRIL